MVDQKTRMPRRRLAEEARWRNAHSGRPFAPEELTATMSGSIMGMHILIPAFSVPYGSIHHGRLAG